MTGAGATWLRPQRAKGGNHVVEHWLELPVDQSITQYPHLSRGARARMPCRRMSRATRLRLTA
jgi:hypothetical protein